MRGRPPMLTSRGDLAVWSIGCSGFLGRFDAVLAVAEVCGGRGATAIA